MLHAVVRARLRQIYDFCTFRARKRRQASTTCTTNSHLLFPGFGRTILLYFRKSHAFLHLVVETAQTEAPPTGRFDCANGPGGNFPQAVLDHETFETKSAETRAAKSVRGDASVLKTYLRFTRNFARFCRFAVAR